MVPHCGYLPWPHHRRYAPVMAALPADGASLSRLGMPAVYSLWPGYGLGLRIPRPNVGFCTGLAYLPVAAPTRQGRRAADLSTIVRRRGCVPRVMLWLVRWHSQCRRPLLHWREEAQAGEARERSGNCGSGVAEGIQAAEADGELAAAPTVGSQVVGRPEQGGGGRRRRSRSARLPAAANEGGCRGGSSDSCSGVAGRCRRSGEPSSRWERQRQSVRRRAGRERGGW